MGLAAIRITWRRRWTVNLVSAGGTRWASRQPAGGGDRRKKEEQKNVGKISPGKISPREKIPPGKLSILFSETHFLSPLENCSQCFVASRKFSNSSKKMTSEIFKVRDLSRWTYPSRRDSQKLKLREPLRIDHKNHVKILRNHLNFRSIKKLKKTTSELRIGL